MIWPYFNAHTCSHDLEHSVIAIISWVNYYIIIYKWPLPTTKLLRSKLFHSYLSPKVSIENFAASMCDELKTLRNAFHKTICQKIWSLLENIQTNEEINGQCIHWTSKKEEVLKLFSECNGKLRLIIATTAFGMGIDCPDIRRIIHWGTPATLEEYVQETRRSGRDGEPATATFYLGVGRKNATYFKGQGIFGKHHHM